MIPCWNGGESRMRRDVCLERLNSGTAQTEIAMVEDIHGINELPFAQNLAREGTS